jgi:hypothetical protein
MSNFADQVFEELHHLVFPAQLPPGQHDLVGALLV